jgi:DNA repair protein SbcC/Rad50
LFLKEFVIRRYGPLTESGKRELGRFNLFFGSNEEGKTLTIDALLKMLFGKGAARYFEAVKRVEENPEGYLVIENRDKKELKLPEAGTFPELFNLSVFEFSNIFVIRDSDLSINDEGDFYRGVTARLTGMRSDEIRTIKNRLHELGSITAGGEFLNVAPQKLKDRLRKAHLLLEKIEPLYVKMQEEGFSRFEEELARLDQKYRELMEKLGQYRTALSRERYEKGRAALNKILEADTALSELKFYKQSDYETWQRVEMSLEHLQKDRRNLEAELAAKKEILSEARFDKKSRTLVFRKIEQKLKEAIEKIEPLLVEYDKQHNLVLKNEILTDNPFFNRTVLIAILILFLSLIGYIFQPSLWIFLLLLISTLVTASLGWLRFSLLGKKGRMAPVEMQVCSKAEELGLFAANIHEVRVGLGNLRSEATNAAENLNEAEKEVEWHHKESEQLAKRLEEKMRKIEDLEEKLKQIQQELAVDKLSQFAALLKRKQKLNNEIDKQRSLLESHFGRQSEMLSDKDRISFWMEQVEELSSYAQASFNLKYDQREVSRITEKIETVKKSGQELHEKMKERLEELRDLEKEINDLLYLDEDSYLPCQTTLDLEIARLKLQEWITEQDNNKKAALIALEIFADLEAEEEQKVTALFGQDSPVSDYFNKITGGRYREVIFESRDNPIRIIRHNGVELDAAKLSGGAYDQLYFAIRLSLGEKLLEGEKGFFILDDPFIKADPARLKALIAMLFEICTAGWQILYFSAKGEVKEILQDKITAKAVQEFSIGQSNI